MSIRSRGIDAHLVIIEGADKELFADVELEVEQLSKTFTLWANLLNLLTLIQMILSETMHIDKQDQIVWLREGHTLRIVLVASQMGDWSLFHGPKCDNLANVFSFLKTPEGEITCICDCDELFTIGGEVDQLNAFTDLVFAHVHEINGPYVIISACVFFSISQID